MTPNRTPQPFRRVAASLAAGALAAVLATGCTAGDGDAGGRDVNGAPSSSGAGVAAGAVCHGLFAGDAGKALAAALGTGTFARSTDTDSVGAAAGKLAEEPVAGGSAWRERRMCTLYKDTDSKVAELTVDAERVLPAVADAPRKAPDAAAYELGRRAWADPNKAAVFVDCVSPRLAGSEGGSPAVVSVSAWNRTSPRGDTAAYREANLAMAHAAALALVKELGCKGAAGLPEHLTVQEIPAG